PTTRRARSRRSPGRPACSRPRCSAARCTWWCGTRRRRGRSSRQRWPRTGVRPAACDACPRPPRAGSCRSCAARAAQWWGEVMLSAQRLLAVARKEWIQLRRDRRSMILAFALPVFLLLFFGYAINWDVTDIALAVRDEDRTQRSRALVEAFEESGYFRVAGWLERRGEAETRLARGEVTGVLVVPAGFARDLAAGRPAPVQLLLDGADANTATIALNYADAIAARFSRDVLLEGRRVEPPVSAETRVWYNPTLESRHMIVPALIAVIMSIIAAMLTAVTIAREWERGTMEQLAATPVHRLEVVFGKLLPYVGIGLFDVAVAALAGVLVFGVPFNGSVVLLAVIT